MKYCLLFAYAFLSLHLAHAQDEGAWSGIGVESNYSLGSGIKHSQNMKVGFYQNVNAFDLSILQQTTGKKDWQQRRHYPLLGFAFTYTDYDRNKVYGRAVSMYPFIRIPLIHVEKLEWSIKAGFGLAYISKRYSLAPDWDTLNTAIGSHVNNYTAFATDFRYRINRHIDVQLGADFAHISNAAFRKPNLGINKYGAHIGIRYFPVTSEPKKIHSELTPLKNRILVQARFGMSAAEQGAPNGPMYPIYLGTVYASRRYAGKNKMYIGADYSYHTNVYRFQLNNEINPGHEKEKSWKGALLVGNEFLIGRVGIIFQLGYYVHLDVLTRNTFYEKLGGNLYLVQREKGFVKEVFPYIYLKTHGIEAELVEAGIGFGF